jgi:transposase
MSRPSNTLLPAINYDHTLVLGIELSNKSWVLAAQVPGLPQTKAQRTIEPNKNALLTAMMATELALPPSVTRSSA